MSFVSNDDVIHRELTKLWGSNWSSKVSVQKQQMLIKTWKELETGSARWQKLKL